MFRALGFGWPGLLVESWGFGLAGFWGEQEGQFVDAGGSRGLLVLMNLRV